MSCKRKRERKNDERNSTTYHLIEVILLYYGNTMERSAVENLQLSFADEPEKSKQHHSQTVCLSSTSKPVPSQICLLRLSRQFLANLLHPDVRNPTSISAHVDRRTFTEEKTRAPPFSTRSSHIYQQVATFQFYLFIINNNKCY